MDSKKSDLTNSYFSPLSGGMLDGAHNLRIDGANFTSVAGNSIRDSSSRVFVIVKQESGVTINTLYSANAPIPHMFSSHLVL